MVTWWSQNGWEDVCRDFFCSPDTLSHHDYNQVVGWNYAGKSNLASFCFSGRWLYPCNNNQLKDNVWSSSINDTYIQDVFLGFFPGDFLRILPWSQPPGSIWENIFGRLYHASWPSKSKEFLFQSPPVKPRRRLGFFSPEARYVLPVRPRQAELQMVRFGSSIFVQQADDDRWGDRWGKKRNFISRHFKVSPKSSEK